MKPSLFTGQPALRPAAKPSIRAVWINGQLRKPRDVYERICCMVTKVAPNALLFLKGDL